VELRKLPNERSVLPLLDLTIGKTVPEITKELNLSKGNHSLVHEVLEHLVRVNLVHREVVSLTAGQRGARHGYPLLRWTITPAGIAHREKNAAKN